MHVLKYLVLSFGVVMQLKGHGSLADLNEIEGTRRNIRVLLAEDNLINMKVLVILAFNFSSALVDLPLCLTRCAMLPLQTSQLSMVCNDCFWMPSGCGVYNPSAGVVLTPCTSTTSCPHFRMGSLAYVTGSVPVMSEPEQP